MLSGRKQIQLIFCRILKRPSGELDEGKNPCAHVQIKLFKKNVLMPKCNYEVQTKGCGAELFPLNSRLSPIYHKSQFHG